MTTVPETPPYESTELEIAVCCSLMDRPELVPEVALQLDPKEFYSRWWGRVYAAILSINAMGVEPNFVRVHDYLGDITFATLAEAHDKTLTGPAIVESAIPIIKKRARLRAAKTAMIEAIEQLGQPGTDLMTQFEGLNKDFMKILREENGTVTAAEQVLTTMKRIDSQDKSEFVKIGLRAVDNTTGGAQRGESWLIAGRPSMGKSSLAATCLLNMARMGYPVVYVNAEGTRHSLMCRLLSIYTGIDLRNIRTGGIDAKECQRLAHAAGVFATLPMFFIEENRWGKIRVQIQTLKMQEPKLAAVFIDYIGLIQLGGTFREREREVAFLSADIKRLALDLGIVCVPLCQLNRMVESRKDHRPMISDLRESGAIEQDADVILFPYRPSYYGEKVDHATDAEISIAKNREGQTGTAHVKFEAHCVRFSERDG